MKSRDIPSGRARCTSRHSTCWCSRPARCNAREEVVPIIVVRLARKEMTKQVVVPQRPSKKTWLPPFTRAGEPEVDRRSEVLLSQFLCTQKTGTGRTITSGSCGFASVEETNEWMMRWDIYLVAREDERMQEIKRWKRRHRINAHGRNARHHEWKF
jgi:hypothetical protein